MKHPSSSTSVELNLEFVLRSPVHGMVSKTILLITFSGRKSGKTYTTPVSYSQHDDRVFIFTHADWWKNLRGGAPVTLRLRGRQFQGLAEPVAEDKQAIAAGLAAHLRKAPSDARYYGVTFDGQGNPRTEEVEVAVQTVVMTRVRLCECPINKLEKVNLMRTQSIYKTPAGERAVMNLYDSMLARLPVPYETLHIPTRHGSTFIIASGKVSASPLVLLHGAGSNSLIWAGDIAEYSRQYRVYAVDLLGEPGKSAPNRPAWDSPAYVEWLEDILDALKIEKATLIGFSQGGWTAMKFAVNKPERVEKLVLLAPGGIVPDKLTFVFKAIPLSLLGRWGIHRINRMLLAGQLVSSEVEEALTLIMTYFKPRVGALPIFTDTELQRLKMPILLLMGAKDALRNAEAISTRMQKQAPNLTVAIIPGCGHALLNTTGQILPFLAEDNHS